MTKKTKMTNKNLKVTTINVKEAISTSVQTNVSTVQERQPARNSVAPATKKPADTAAGKEKAVDQEKEAMKKTLIMFLWISLFFCSSRITYAIDNMFSFLAPDSFYYSVSHVINFSWTAFVYASYTFVYLNTNKIFKKNFYRIFLRKDVK